MSVLVLGLVLVLVALVTVVVDVSAVFIAQRSLSGAADAAAVAAAGAVDEDAVYRGTAGGATLPLGDVRSAVVEQVTAAGVGQRFPGLAVDAASDGTTATVVLAADVPLPFVGVVAPDASWRVEVTASARSPYGP
ncbi:pilus assembly protein TadG-related protein [Vallicoccus soli]|uniref:pilus assembly protein TadG-related protein n=1 Tax=Vallicoccus soli TaxID=2339232 RepID=UPI001C49993E|nr:pilus assembly protein TadG-related protein [Vallicoccus soli]